MKRFLLIAVAVLVVIQFIRPRFTNPPVDAGQTIQAVMPVPANVQTILRRSCYDCHSSETRLPWYSQVAPASWLLARDIDEGRRHLSFSEFATYSPKQRAKKLKAICDQVKSGDMPPWFYTPMHAGAKLSPADRQTLCAW